MVQKKKEEFILNYQRMHAGAMPPQPLKTKMYEKACFCCIKYQRNRPRTNLYEAPVVAKKAKKRRKEAEPKKKTKKVSPQT